MQIVMRILAALTSAYGLSGPNLLGKDVVDVRGDAGVVVVFVSAKCPCSRSHVAVLKRLAGEYPNFKFVGVHANADESLADATVYFAAQKLPFPIIEDEGQRLLNRFGASRTPHAFVLDRDERVVYRGGVSDGHDGARAGRLPLREALEDLRAARPVRRADARALGCTIARGTRAI